MRDERALLGLVALHVLLAAPGAVALICLGLLRPRPSQLLLAAGPAFLLGIVICGVSLVALVAIGIPVSRLVMATAIALATVALGGLARVTATAETASTVARPPLCEMALERTVLGVTAAYFVFGTLAFTNLPTLWDDANIWSLKALALYYHDGFVDGVGRNPQLTYAHIDYPILQPLLEAGFFRAIGEVDLRLWHLELWVVFAAALWTLAWLLASLGGRWLWVVVIAVIAVAPVAGTNVTLGDADLTMAALVGCGALAFGLWLERGNRSHALLGAVFVGGAANVKNEGLAFGLALFLALALVVATTRPRSQWRDFGLGLAITVACVLPWQLWVATNDAAARATPSPFELIDDPDYLVDRLGFLWRGTEQVVTQLIDSPGTLLVPAFLVTVGVLIATRTRRDVASFYFLGWLLSGLAVCYTYWVTPIFDLDGFEQRTGPRIVLGVVFVAAAGLAHLLQIASTDGLAGDEQGVDESDSAGIRPPTLRVAAKPVRGPATRTQAE